MFPLTRACGCGEGVAVRTAAVSHRAHSYDVATVITDKAGGKTNFAVLDCTHLFLSEDIDAERTLK